MRKQANYYKEIESVIKNFSTNKSNHLKVFQKIEEEGTLPNWFYELSSTLIEDHRRKLQVKLPREHRCKILNQLLANWIQQYIKRIIHHKQVEFIPRMQVCFHIHYSINMTHVNTINDKSHMNRYRKSIWKKSTSTHAKICQ